MDDFLHNLRKNTERNYEKRNKPQYNNPQYRGPERRGARDQQRRPFQKKSEFEDLMVDLMPGIKALLTGIEEGQRKVIEVVERTVEAQVRQVEIFETIAVLLQNLVEGAGDDVPFSGPFTADSQGQSEVHKSAQPASPAMIDRDEVVESILRLREDGMTYKEIAQRLEDEHVPTFSGKGAWHAQTVHKVCNRGV
ncbi:MAG: recombinase family protein [Desulfobacterales bacterium]|nr:recombinase family protein [Desulfobacterales bacterium]